MNHNETDWNLVVQAQISISWLFESSNSQDSNLQAAVAKFRAQNENCELINPGILFAYAYITLVYPRETALEKISTTALDCSEFTFKAGKQKDLIRRLRNSIAHGRYSISSDAVITFKDNCRCGNDPFEVEVSCGDFGSFLHCFCNLSKAKYFDKK